MLSHIKNKKTAILIFIIGIFIFASQVLALETNWPPSPAGTTLTEESTLPKLMQYLYEWGIGLGGLAVFIVLIIAGFQYVSSFGDPQDMKDAMNRIKSASLGLILLLSSWLILNTINSDLTSAFVEPFKISDIPSATDQSDEPETNSKPCESATVFYSGGQFPVAASDGCKAISISGAALISSKGIPPDCMGNLQFFTSSDCTDMVFSGPVDNANLSIDRSRLGGVKLLKIDIEK